MAIKLKPGLRLRSAVDTTEVMVVRAPNAEVELACGGHAMLAPGEEAADGAGLDQAWADGTLIGKRYAEEEIGIELLCTRAGEGSLALNGAVLAVKDAKPLPSSD